MVDERIGHICGIFQDDQHHSDRRGRGGLQHFQHLATAASTADEQGLNSTHFIAIFKYKEYSLLH